LKNQHTWSVSPERAIQVRITDPASATYGHNGCQIARASRRISINDLQRQTQSIGMPDAEVTLRPAFGHQRAFGSLATSVPFVRMSSVSTRPVDDPTSSGCARIAAAIVARAAR
jgi:hypothetical protein